MSALPHVLLSLHQWVLAGFLGVTAMLMAVTLLNRFRVRGVLLSWGGGRLWQIPRWPALFMVGVLAFWAVSLFTGQRLPAYLFLGYLLGGTFWLVSVLFATTTVVTQCGLLCHARGARTALAWGEVVDYFACHRHGRYGYVFFYHDAAGRRRRLDLAVPAAYREAFRHILSRELDERFELAVQPPPGKKALEG